MGRLDTLHEQLINHIEGVRDHERRVWGPRLGRLLGRGRPSASDGLGDPDDPDVAKMFPVHDYRAGAAIPSKRLVPVTPYSAGDAVIGAVPGYGQVGASAWPVVLGRLAQGSLDCDDEFWISHDAPDPETWDAFHGQPATGLTTAVRIPINAPCLLKATSFVMVRGASESTYVRVRQRIGGNNDISIPSRDNTDAAFGDDVRCPRGPVWMGVQVIHERRFFVAREHDDPDGYPITVGPWLFRNGSAGDNDYAGGWTHVERIAL